VKEELRKALSRRQKLRNLEAGLTPSAVLIPIFDKGGAYHIVFTRRSHRVKVHKGEISFPGGAYEEEDEVLLNTALRECAEEIGLPTKDVDVLGELDDIPTVGSEYVISPFVASIPWPYVSKLDPWEVDSIIEVPIGVLLDKVNVSLETEFRRGQPVVSYSYRYQDDLIWGASARILHQLLEIWTKLEG
jgi:8-oxo-dGTP pyrophosphatase MutT (NUDIX family)